MRILLGIALLVTLALIASSRRFWSLRRTPIGAALTTGELEQVTASLHVSLSLSDVELDQVSRR